MKNKTVAIIVSVISIILFITIIANRYLNSDVYQTYIDNNNRQLLIKDIPLLGEDFLIIESDKSGSWFGETSYFYLIEYNRADYEKQLVQFETSSLYQNTDGYLNEIIIKDYNHFEQIDLFSEITKCDCYQILKKISYTSKYSEYIYLMDDYRFAIIIDKN